MIKKYLIPILVGLGMFFFGLMLGDRDRFEGHHKACHQKYHFINSDVVCGPSVAIKKTGYAETQGKLNIYIDGAKIGGRATDVAVYFRDLENGPIFGINESAEFAPASLLKLPLALVYLTSAERTPELLEEKLFVAKPQWNFIENFRPQNKIDPREPHTVNQLLMHMLAYSDNDAYGVLQAHLYESGQEDLIKKTFLELGFLDPADHYSEVLSVRRYGAIFRALYNISYVNADASERVLQWLALSPFKDGLAGGVPEGVVIAHKFGERYTDDGKKQLHDCGIIYYPQNPYLLCVMTKGKDFAELSAIIRHISSEVYQEVDSRRLDR